MHHLSVAVQRLLIDVNEFLLGHKKFTSQLILLIDATQLRLEHVHFLKQLCLSVLNALQTLIDLRQLEHIGRLELFLWLLLAPVILRAAIGDMTDLWKHVLLWLIVAFRAGPTLGL